MAHFVFLRKILSPSSPNNILSQFEALVHQRSKTSKSFPGYYTVPGGSIDPEEKSAGFIGRLNAGLREAREEAGNGTPKGLPLLAYRPENLLYYNRSTMSNTFVFYHVIQNEPWFDWKPEPEPDHESEVVPNSYMWFTLDDIYKTKTPEIVPYLFFENLIPFKQDIISQLEEFNNTPSGILKHHGPVCKNFLSGQCSPSCPWEHTDIRPPPNKPDWIRDDKYAKNIPSFKPRAARPGLDKFRQSTLPRPGTTRSKPSK